MSLLLSSCLAASWLAVADPGLQATCSCSSGHSSLGEDYAELVARAVAEAREGSLQTAAEMLERAVALDPARPEAWVERAGLHFMEKRYDHAIRDLQSALRLREDAYARNLLAASLHLDGQSDEALESWNALGWPILRTFRIRGLVHARNDLLRREIGLAEGGVLAVDELRASRLRLRELGIVDEAIFRTVPRGEGVADLDLAVVERHGITPGWRGFLLAGVVNLAHSRTVMRYSNLFGSGVSVGGAYRWQENRPEVRLGFQAPRPLGLPGYLHVQAWRGRQAFEVGGPFVARGSGIELTLRHVLGPRTIGALGLRAKERQFLPARTQDPSGRLRGMSLGVERVLVESPRQRLEASAGIVQALRGLGSVSAYTKGLVSLRYEVAVAPTDRVPAARSVLAGRLRWGQGSRSTPVDELFAPGASADMELPLRGRSQAPDGVLGRTALAQSVLLLNLQLRHLVRPAHPPIGVVLFYDGGRIQGQPFAKGMGIHDAGVGLRLGLGGRTTLRIDFGHGMTDGRNHVSAGLTEAF